MSAILGSRRGSHRGSLAHWLRLLFDRAPPLRFDSELPFIAAGVIHLPSHGSAMDARAAAAHAAAHLVYSPPRFDGSGLGPLARALVGLLEDARVEALAMRELPGLARLWRPLHAATPAAGASGEALLQRLARALADPTYDDPDPWVRKGRALCFFDAGLRVLALRTAGEVRHAATLLGHDLGQMRAQLNAKTYRPAPAYRDDHRWMWAADAVESVAPPPVAAAGERRDDDPAPVEADAFVTHHPEWDRLIGRLRPDWCRVVERPTTVVAGDEPRAGARAGSAASAERRTRSIESSDARMGSIGSSDDRMGSIGSSDGRMGSIGSSDDRIGSIGSSDARTHSIESSDDRTRSIESSDGRARSAGYPVAAASASLRASLLAVARSPAGIRRDDDGDAFNPEALVDWRVARRMGAAGDPRVYREVDRRPLRAAVWLLVDRSASSADPLVPNGPSVLRIAAEVAAATARALQDHGVACAVATFASQGRHDVSIDVVKSFGERVDATTTARLLALRPGGSTRLGAAVRHAVGRLAAHGAARWVIVFSDGEPHDVDVHDPRYLVEDARHAVREAARHAVRVVCVALAAQRGADALRVFGGGGVASLQTPDQLARAFRRLLH